MRFFWGGHFEFFKSAILNFFLLHISEKPSPFIWGHSGRSYYIDLLLIKMAVLAMFQENWSQFKIPSTNWQQFPKQGTGHFSNQFSKN